MDPITVSATISRPREVVFEYLADIANHPEFTDHYLVDWRLTREDSYGRGAGARFRIKAPLNRFGWADISFVEVQPPYRLVQRGRGGKYNRIKMLGVYELSPGASGTTRVTYTFETAPVLPSDRLMEAFGGRAWFRWKMGRAMRRLRTILEDGRGRGRRVSVSAR